MTPLVGAATFVPARPHYLHLPRRITNVRRGVADETLTPKTAQTEARRAGLRYEAKAKEHLRLTLPGTVFGSWWLYQDVHNVDRRCQTDAVWFDLEHKRVTVIEIKRNHATESWWQLRHLYQPILKEFLGPGGMVNVVEMVQSFDCSVMLPEPIFDVEEIGLAGWCREFREGFGVYRWRPV